jgi:hypothetical protein
MRRLASSARSWRDGLNSSGLCGPSVRPISSMMPAFVNPSFSVLQSIKPQVCSIARWLRGRADHRLAACFSVIVARFDMLIPLLAE